MEENSLPDREPPSEGNGIAVVWLIIVCGLLFFVVYGYSSNKRAQAERDARIDLARKSTAVAACMVKTLSAEAKEVIAKAHFENANRGLTGQGDTFAEALGSRMSSFDAER